MKSSEQLLTETLNNIYSVLKSDTDCPGSILTLRKTVRKLNFHWKKTNNKKIMQVINE